MSPQDDLSARDLISMFIAKDAYQRAHDELTKRVEILEARFDAHVQWINKVQVDERQFIHEQIDDVRRVITDKLEVQDRKLNQTEQRLTTKLDEQAHDRQMSTIAKVGWMVAVFSAVGSPILLVIIQHTWK